MRRFLIVTADDFGLHEAVEEAVRRGVLSAASIMVAAPAADDAIRRARALPQLRVGLHLTLADGAAALPPQAIPDLVDRSGRFGDSMFRDGCRYFALPSVRRQLEAEIRAQFAAFAATGLALDHVNAHKHFHLHPTLLGIVLRVGAEFGLRAVRVPAEPLWFSMRRAPVGALLAAAGLGPWLALMRRRLRRAGIACNDHIFGVAASGAMDERTLLEALARLPDGVTEIYLHPATRSGTAISTSMGGYRHEAELAALTSARVRDAIVRTGAACGGYGDLSGNAGAGSGSL